MPDDLDLLSVRQIAEHLSVAQITVRRWIDAGKLPSVRLGRAVRVRRTDLEAFIERGRKKK